MVERQERIQNFLSLGVEESFEMVPGRLLRFPQFVLKRRNVLFGWFKLEEKAQKRSHETAMNVGYCDRVERNRCFTLSLNPNLFGFSSCKQTTGREMSERIKKEPLKLGLGVI